MTATGNPGDDHKDVGPDAGQPEDAPPPPQWLNEGEQPSGAAPLLPEPAPLPPFGTPLPEEPEEDTNRTVSDIDVSGMSTQIFKKEEAAPDTEPPPLPPFPGATGTSGEKAGEDAENSDYTVADPAKWQDSDAVDGAATMIVDADKTMQVNGQPPAPPAPPEQPEAPSEQPEAPSDATRIEQAVEPETQQIAGARQPPPPPVPEPFPWAQEIPGTPTAPPQPSQPPAPPAAPQPPAPQPFPWAQEIPGTPTAPPQPSQPPAPEPFPYAQEIPGTPTAPAQPNQPVSPQPFPWAQEIPGSNAQPPTPVNPVSPPPQIDEPWRTTPQQGKPEKKKKGKKGLLIGVAGIAAAALIAGGGYAVVTMLGEDDGKGGGGARLAGSTFAVSGSAGTDGRDQQINGVAAVGSTVVAVGAETGADGSRGVFLVSGDNGSTFTSAQVQGADGAANSADVPQAVSGSAKGWIAVGSGKGGGSVWTSTDGKSWKKEPAAVGRAFGPGGRVQEIVSTGSGFLAYGTKTVKGSAQPTVWLSADGRQWEARTGEQIGLKVEKASYSLADAVASGDALLLMALVKPDNKKPPLVRQVYRSEDGGRTWAAAKIPVPKGSRGLAIGGGDAGFVAMREMGKKDSGHGVAFVSKDGSDWTEAGKLETDGYQNTTEILSDANGYTALVSREGDVLLASSADGKAWKAAGNAPKKPGRAIVDSAAAGGQTVLVGHESGGGDMDPVLNVWGTDGRQVPIDPSKIAGLIRPDHVVRAVEASDATAVAVGSASGDAAVWTSSDGSAWKPAQGLGSAFTRPGPQRLLDVADGSAGWAAVGYDQAAPMRPLVVTSADGATWQAADSAAAFQTGGKGRLVTNAVAAGSGGYVIVGTHDYSAAVWHSADLKNWEKGTGTDATVLEGRNGSNRWMLDVAAPASGFVAVGGHRDAQGNHPAVWSSADGKQWTLKSLPVPSGVSEAHLTHVAAKGDTLVAAGIAATQQGLVWIGYTSADGGKTWKDLPVPGDDRKISMTALTATPDGFAAAARSTASGSADVVSLTSKDGTSWEAAKPGGTGLGGDGDQEITGLAPFGETVLGVGQNVDANGAQPVLWER